MVLDEPSTGFDPEARHSFWDLIALLKSEGTTILLTTHYLDEAARLGDRAAVISGGRLLAIGPMSAIGGDEARVPIVQWREDGVLHRLRTTEPARTVAELHSRIGEPTALEVVRPSLEDIYLDLIREDRDAVDLIGEPA